MAHEIDVAALLARNVIVDDDRQLGGIRFGQRSGAGFGDEQIDGAEIFGNLVGEAEHLHRRRQRRRQLGEFLRERLVAAADDDEFDGKPCFGERQRRREQFSAALAAGHQHHDRHFGGEPELRAQIVLAAGDVVELRMNRMTEQSQTRRRHAARQRALVDFARRDDDGVRFGHEPRFVHFAEIGDDGNDRHVLHVRVVARAQRRVVEQRMHGDDDVGLIADEKIAQALAIERLAEAHQRLIAAPSVGRIVERAVDRRRVAQRHAVTEAELRQREGAMGGDVLDAVFVRL